MNTESVLNLKRVGWSAGNRHAGTRRSFCERKHDGAAMPRSCVSAPSSIGARGILGVRLDNARCVTQLHRCGEASVEAFARSCVAGA